MMKISFSRLRASVDKSSSRQGQESCATCNGRTQSMSNVHHFECLYDSSLSGIMLNSSGLSGVERCRSASSRSIANLCQMDRTETGCKFNTSGSILQSQRSFLHAVRYKISKKFWQGSSERDLGHRKCGGSSWLMSNSRMASESQYTQELLRQRSSKKSSAANSVYPAGFHSAPRDPGECMRMVKKTTSSPSTSLQKEAQVSQVEATHCSKRDGTQYIYQQVKVGMPSPQNRSALDWSLAQELQSLVNYGWYWGPIARVEAEELLTGKPDGAFLVRDSSDDHYVLSLSFRSCGKTRHTRIQHCNNMFSFYVDSASDLDSFPSIPDLIKHSMEKSEGGVLCYGKDSWENTQVLPVRLTKPVSRLERVRSLQSLCRFVIRQSVRLDQIQQLPLPQTVKTFIEEKLF